MPEGRRPEGHGGMPEGNQDKRIRKPKLEKGKERKLKMKEKKEHKKSQNSPSF